MMESVVNSQIQDEECDEDVFSELCRSCSSSFSNLDAMEVNSFLAAINTLKVVYEDSPEVYHMLLQVLHDYNPASEHGHSEKTAKYIRNLLKRKTPEIAEFLISSLPTPEKRVAGESLSQHRLNDNHIFKRQCPESREEDGNLEKKSQKDIKFYNFIEPDFNAYVASKGIPRKILSSELQHKEDHSNHTEVCRQEKPARVPWIANSDKLQIAQSQVCTDPRVIIRREANGSHSISLNKGINSPFFKGRTAPTAAPTAIKAVPRQLKVYHEQPLLKPARYTEYQPIRILSASSENLNHRTAFSPILRGRYIVKTDSVRKFSNLVRGQGVLENATMQTVELNSGNEESNCTNSQVNSPTSFELKLTRPFPKALHVHSIPPINPSNSDATKAESKNTANFKNREEILNLLHCHESLNLNKTESTVTERTESPLQKLKKLVAYQGITNINNSVSLTEMANLNAESSRASGKEILDCNGAETRYISLDNLNAESCFESAKRVENHHNSENTRHGHKTMEAVTTLKQVYSRPLMISSEYNINNCNKESTGKAVVRISSDNEAIMSNQESECTSSEDSLETLNSSLEAFNYESDSRATTDYSRIYDDHPLEILKRHTSSEMESCLDLEAVRFEVPDYLGRLLGSSRQPNYKDPWGLRPLNKKQEFIKTRRQILIGSSCLNE